MKKLLLFKKVLIGFCIFIICISLSHAQDLLWVKQMGNTGNDQSNYIAVDALGNVYTTGGFSDIVDFDPGAGSFNLTSAGGFDIFVSKLDASGNFVWAKQMGGTGLDYAYSISVDASGNVYTTGTFSYTADFDPGAGTYNLTSVGSDDIFISKLDASGNFVWAKQIKEKSNMAASGCISHDSSGNIYTTGYFFDTTDFDPGPGIFNLIPAGDHPYMTDPDIFISKLDASGNFVWAKQLGGEDTDMGRSLALDGLGNVYESVLFKETADFDPGTGTFNLTSNGGYQDICIIKLDPAGNFIWAKQIGSPTIEECGFMSVDASGNIYSTGYFLGTTDFDPGDGTFYLTPVGNYDSYILKLDSSGNFKWAKQIGGSDYEFGNLAVTDSFGNIYASGYFSGTVDFDPGAGVFNLTSAGGYDIYITKLDSSGSFLWVKQLGGTGQENGCSVIDANGNIYTTGIFDKTTDFDPGAGTFNLTSKGSYDIFVHKMSGTSGIEITSAGNSLFTVYPNPCSQTVNLIFSKPLSDATIRVINMNGQIVLEKIHLFGKEISFDLSGQLSGIYIIESIQAESILRSKLIK